MGDECKANLKYGGGGDWQYGPWGEDLFQQRCLDRHGVDKLPGYGLTNTGTCPNNRPKTDKKNSKYIPSCYDFKAAVLHPFRDTKGFLPAWARLRTRTTPTSELVPPKASRGYQPTHGTAIQSPITFCECWRKACTDLWPPPCSGAGLAAFAFDPAEAFAIARHTMASRD